MLGELLQQPLRNLERPEESKHLVLLSLNWARLLRESSAGRARMMKVNLEEAPE